MTSLNFIGQMKNAKKDFGFGSKKSKKFKKIQLKVKW